MTTSTLGPTDNEQVVDYTSGDGAHKIILLDKMSPDILLTHQSKMAAFYRIVDPATSIDPVPRDVKKVILKDYL